ncbi:MFS transporter [Streptomyces sp. p1417]|uniref:MFS transporter n=1 Tax=Streptomyces typhae TaxID=2681492 RepID=A0A6L6WUE2_9ACTN|nr:MFS transporter [Streptomyces typhae]MVO84784.1 MFS transporter [Streptomyces typhae]
MPAPDPHTDSDTPTDTRDADVSVRADIDVGVAPAALECAADGEAGGVLGKAHRALSIGVVSVVLLIAFEATAVGTAMPVAARELDGVSLYAFAFSGYFTTSLFGMVLSGQWADRRGPLGPLAVGISAFAAGLVLSGTAAVMWMFILGRAVQGLGGGLVIVALYVIVSRAYPERLRPAILAAFAACWVVPSVVGPLISGTITEHLGWRWVFLGIPVLVLAPLALALPAIRRTAAGPVDRVGPEGPGDSAGPGAPEAPAGPGDHGDPAGSGDYGGPVGPGDHADPAGSEDHADPAGPGAPEAPAEPGDHSTPAAPDRTPDRRRIRLALGISLGAGLLQYAGQDLRPLSLLPAALGAALLVPAVLGLLPRGTYRAARGLPSVVLLRGVAAGSFVAAESFVPLMLVTERGLSPTLAGLSLAAGGATWALGSYVQSRPRMEPHRGKLVALGMVLVAGAIAAVPSVLVDAVPVWIVAVAWGVGCLGMGVVIASTSVLLLRLSPPADAGANSAALQISDGLSNVVLLAAGGAAFAALGGGTVGGHGTGSGADAAGSHPVAFAAVFLPMAAVALFGAWVGTRLRAPR